MEQLTMKSLFNILAERDAAIHERNLALAERKVALAERDMAILQRDAAIAERDGAIMERDNAVAALQHQDSFIHGSNLALSPSVNGMLRGTKALHHHQHMHHLSHSDENAYNPKGLPVSDAFPISAVTSESGKQRKVQRTKETRAVSPKKSFKSSRKGKNGAEDLSKQVTIASSNGWTSGQDSGSKLEDLNRQHSASKPEWKDNLGLNQVNFDESTMPAPVCSCTGEVQQCYRWGNGGWQSACCTTALSMYPLPQMPNRRHSRVGGRKMSGSAFAKLLSRLADEGHDLSTPLDLKDHWAKHGTNRYATKK